MKVFCKLISPVQFLFVGIVFAASVSCNPKYDAKKVVGGDRVIKMEVSKEKARILAIEYAKKHLPEIDVDKHSMKLDFDNGVWIADFTDRKKRGRNNGYFSIWVKSETDVRLFRGR